MKYQRAVAIDNSFLLVGGSYDDGETKGLFNKELYKFNPSNEAWTALPVQIQVGRSPLAAAVVDETKVPLKNCGNYLLV